MLIKIKNVELSTPPGKKYQQAEIVYGDDKGETKTKKLLSFKNPAVFALLKDAKSGEFYEVTNVKIGEYWEWTEAAKSDGSSGLPAKTAVGVRTSNYETPEERAARQVLIVKQSCLAQAIEYYKHPTLAKANVTENDVLIIADTFVSWVFNNDTVKTEEELGDIPF